jgi:hypothetical protein
MTTLDSRGKPVTLPSVTAALREIQLSQIAAIRKHCALQLEALTVRLDDLSQQIEKRSQVFQRSLLYDGMTREKLEREVTAIRARIPAAPPVVKFLEGKQNLTHTSQELLPLLPSYALSGRSLTSILTDDPAKYRLVVQLLRHLRPFTPIDREVEEQQGLKNRRDTFVILEVPGGQDGTLAELLLREGIVTNKNQVVDSGDDEIRMSFLRDGLPYAAIRPLAKYKERHDSFLATLAAITPYTVAQAHQFPGLEASRTNLRLHTERLLYAAKAVLPHRVAQKTSGGFTLRYEKDTDYDFTATDEENFLDWDSMVGWLAKRVAIRKALEAELNHSLDADPAGYKAALVAAWQQAAGNERDHLMQALGRLKVNPHTFAQARRRPEPQNPATPTSAVA